MGTYFYVCVSQEIQIMITSDGWNQTCTVCTRSAISHNATLYFISCKMLTHTLISNHMFNLLLLCSSSWCFPVLTTKFLWFCSNLSSRKPRDSDTARQRVSLPFLGWWIAVLWFAESNPLLKGKDFVLLYTRTQWGLQPFRFLRASSKMKAREPLNHCLLLPTKTILF